MTAHDATIRQGTIVSVASDGAGVLRSEGQKVVFVPGALLGEDVIVRVLREHRRYDTAQLLEVTRPSSQRVTPPCYHYATCGGCHIQHLDAKSHGPLKKTWFLDACRRLGGIGEHRLLELESKLSTVVLAAEGYRVRARLHLMPTNSSPQRAPASQTSWTLGYARRAGSCGSTSDNDPAAVVAVTSCTILHPILASCIRPIQGVLSGGSDLGLPAEPLQLELTLCNGSWPQGDTTPTQTQPQVAMTLYRQGRRRLALSPGQSHAFLQALIRAGVPVRLPAPKAGSDILCIAPSAPAPGTQLPFALDEADLAPFPAHRLGFVQPHGSAPAVYRGWLRSRVLEALGRESEQDAKVQQGTSEVWDLYSGSGLLGHALTSVNNPIDGRPLVDHLVCVEDNTHALAASPKPLRGQTAERLGLSTESFLAQARRDRRRRAPRWVIADPPRTGLGRKTTENLVQCLKTLGPHGRRDVFLISCDGAAAARDLADLTALGLAIEQVVLVDAFGQTRHYEILSHLVFRT